LTFLVEQEFVVSGIVADHVLPEFLLKCRIVRVEFLGDEFLCEQRFFLDLEGNPFEEVVLVQEKPEEFEFDKGHREDRKLLMIDRIVNVESELFEVARDHIDALGLIVFVIEGLIADFLQVFGIGSFQLDHGDSFPVFEYGPVCFLRVFDVFEFRSQVKIRLRIDRVAQDFDKKLPKKSLLKLFFFGVADIFPDDGIVEVS
jgi:hypothetical protein